MYTTYSVYFNLHTIITSFLTRQSGLLSSTYSAILLNLIYLFLTLFIIISISL
nr:MAG TPA: hypothetical protein [Caudoviricetes sp.]